VPATAPPTGLPVEDVVADLRAALDGPGHAVLVAPPGSGKTTVIPLRLLEAPWAATGKIVVLEPRRLATRAAARRMAFLLGEEVGATAGYVTRDDRATGPTTRIEVVTEGVLTRRIQRDPSLRGTAAVVFDELHERNLQTDLGLALTLDARKALRPDLRLLAMSATIDADRVAHLLGGDRRAPVVIAGAPVHPVEVRWAPAPRRARLEPHVAAVIRSALATHPGDVLVFLPGMAEIRRVAEHLDGIDAEVHLLHGSLPPDQQDAAIAPAPPGTRKVVLATDIAETSLTVEGVGIVVDSGLARAPRFDVRTGMTRLTTVQISKASAEQRTGRAGRTGPGVAFRLWSKLEHGGRRPHIDPEITQVDLAGLALELAAWGTGLPETLRWLDPPPKRAFEEARALLTRLGALDEAGRLTPAGRRMAVLPLHPRLGRMVVDAGDDAYLACLIAALVDERDILRGPPEEVPVDLALRVAVVNGERGHPLAGRGPVGRARRAAEDLAQRAGIGRGSVRLERTGAILALAFPDRLAMRRGSPGRFQLRTGTTAWCPAADPMAIEPFVVAADLDGKRKDARIRIAAAIDPAEVAARFADDVTTQTTLLWEGDRLVARTERRLGGVALDLTDDRPSPGPETTAHILRRLRDRDLADLPWDPASRSIVERVGFLHATVGDPWPDWSPDALAATLEEWLFPVVGSPTGLDDLADIDMSRILRRRLGPLAGELDRLAPTHLDLPRGRKARLDYSGDIPVLAAKVQDLFGVLRTPEVAGVPILVHLLSPADRPVQITRDLAGFWTGSWHDVRKDMAGRYPKHDWPEDPTAR
jgi:ATP-dependent helicase HrpB